MFPVETLNYLLALGVLGMQIVGVAFFALYFLQNKFTDLQDIAALLSRWGLWLAFLLTLVATAMTLYYSEVLGFAPCGWCWVQRVFLWPQALLFGVALWKQERLPAPAGALRAGGQAGSVADFSIALSIPGAAAALYQHYLQMGGSAVIPCPASGAGDCAQRILFEFGYITFPLMAATLFGFLIVLMLYIRKR